MSEICRIIFDNPNNTYFAGQTISGRVEVALQEPKQIKGVRIEIKGAAHVRWTESESDSNSTGGSRDTTYYADEEYFYSRNHLVHGGNQDTFTLSAGSHVYMFSCPLPSSLPTSLEGAYGHIRYEAEVIIERPWIWNQRTKAVFTVISHYNLNAFPHLLSSAMVTAEKFFCCCCCRSGPLTGVLRIPKSGYVCGEKVPAIIEIDNTSNVNISRVNLKFQQSITFRSTFPRTKTRDQKIVFVEINLGSVQPRGSRTMTFSLAIPPLPPSSLNECAIIDTEYQIFLQCVAEGCHTSLEASIPVSIGTIPLTVATAAPAAPAGTSPPSYAEVIGSQVNGEAVGWTGNVMPSAPGPSFNTSEFFKPKSIEAADDDEHVMYNNDMRQYTPTYPIYKYDYPVQQ